MISSISNMILRAEGKLLAKKERPGGRSNDAIVCEGR